MSLLGPRRTSLDVPPRLNGNVLTVARESCAPGAPPKPPQLRPAIHAMMGDTPWFTQNGTGSMDKKTNGSEEEREKEEDRWSVTSESEEESEETKKEEDLKIESEIPAETQGQQEPAKQGICEKVIELVIEKCTREHVEHVEKRDKETQTEEAEADSKRIATLEAKLRKLEKEKADWIEKLERARDKRAHGKKEKLRPFVSSLGDIEHVDFNTMLLGMRDEIYQNTGKQKKVHSQK